MKTLSPRYTAVLASAAVIASALALVAAQPAAVNTPVTPTTPVSAPAPLRLGTVDFPTSGLATAQPHFLHGVAALHSFWYEEAIEAFQRALALDPDFMMAHWGIAMCYDRSYRPGGDHAAGRAALAKITDTAKLTSRERGYIEALRKLYGPSGALQREAYVTEMAKLQKAFPDDHEAAAFHALALLANRSRGFANQEKAGEIAQAVYRHNPNHPGAAHYIIHAYDAPDHAARALDAAHHYAKIAPDAPHALHMPSHIYVQLGMWKEARASNDLGWAASLDYVKRKTLTPTLRDYHNLHWLIYASLQEGRYAQAGQLVDEFVRMRAASELASYSARYINEALANYIIETRSWSRAETLLPAGGNAAASGAAPTSVATAPVPARGPAVEPEICGGEPPAAIAKKSSATKSAPMADTPTFILAFATAASGKADEKSGATPPRFSPVRTLQLKGLIAAHAKDYPNALAALNEAAELEAKNSRPPGPPSGKPAHELLGEILLLAGKPAKAAEEFKIALERHPNRALAVLGLARAEAATGKKETARKTYARLLDIWQQADADLPELREARDFIRTAG